jgi:hypothetical protein
LPGRRDGDANDEQKWRQSGGCSFPDSLAYSTHRDSMGRVRKEDQGCRMTETEIHVAISSMSVSRSTAPGSLRSPW